MFGAFYFGQPYFGQATPGLNASVPTNLAAASSRRTRHEVKITMLQSAKFFMPAPRTAIVEAAWNRDTASLGAGRARLGTLFAVDTAGPPNFHLDG